MVAATSKIHEALRALEDPALELLLMRQCADTGLVTFLLRAVGPERADGRGGIDYATIEELDSVLRKGVEQVVRGEITDDAQQQAGWGVKAGGLGLRHEARAATTIIAG